ncbi:hypothetical protein BASA83_002406 [Batrachochytrium salamandrivorans]|nr:hypothetical protein BASA62_009837 [Batrachochytrium salamandrivorans]KAH9275180.1 hypothetical protein BASA83_002406 [Batrachochytrium salamandrivorans]
MGIAPALHLSSIESLDHQKLGHLPLSMASHKPLPPGTLAANASGAATDVPHLLTAVADTLSQVAVSTATGHYNAHGASKSRAIPSCAHSWSGKVLVGESSLVDEHGRTLLVRGVNMSGNSKLPTSPPGASHHTSENFYDHRNTSFVGRPFPLTEIEEHFERLQAWGLTFARLLVPWEALEHSGPGIYDEEYIDFLILLLKRAPEYGIKCFIDPHQDTWSRYSGGSGAPGWTFEVAGLDLTQFEATGAVHYHDFTTDDDSGKMIWPTNYIKLASATMFTLFFAGDEFAPKLKYLGQSPQSFLQSHFCGAYAHLAARFKLAGVDSVVGFEVINEPHAGYIGLNTLLNFDLMKDLHLANSPTPLQSFALGSGHALSVGFFVKSWPWPTRQAGTRLLNPDGKSAWLPGHSCIWRDHGVWDTDASGAPVALLPHYFRTRRDGTPIDFNLHCYTPFIKRYIDAIRSADPSMVVLFEPVPNDDPPILVDDTSASLRNTIYAPHWYDLKAVFNKSFNGFVTHDVQGLSRGTKNVLQASYFGMTGANRNYRNQIFNIVRAGTERVGLKPCLIGECGIPMDINEKAAFETGDYKHHTNFLDAVINAMEYNLVNFTLWNYNPHNDNAFGDHWNGEDFSIYSRTNSNAPSGENSRQNSRPITRLPSLADLGGLLPDFHNETSADKDLAANHHDGVACSTKLLSVSESSTNLKQSQHLLLPSSGLHFRRMGGASCKEGDAMSATPAPVEAALDMHINIAKCNTSELEAEEVSNNVPLLLSVAGDRCRRSSVGHNREARRMSMTPLTPFDITEICYNDVDEYGHTHAGGRALDAVIRPYAAKIAGKPLKMSFDLKSLTFELYFSTPISAAPLHASSSSTPFITEIYVPNFHYGGPVPPDICVSDGKFTYNRKRQTLYWKINPAQRIEPWVDEPPYSFWKFLFPDTTDRIHRQAGHDVNVHSIRISPCTSIPPVTPLT